MAPATPTALFCLAALGLYALTCTKNDSQPAVLLLLALWAWATCAVARPDEAASRAKLERALKSPSAGTLTIEWWWSWWRALDDVRTPFYVAVVLTISGLALHAAPQSARAEIAGACARAWTSVRGAAAPRDLFLVGTLGVHLVVFWSVSLAFCVLEFWRPACLEPYKVQPDFRLDVKTFGKAARPPRGSCESRRRRGGRGGGWLVRGRRVLGRGSSAGDADSPRRRGTPRISL